jgi:outer membrane protein OmpA-like peptidoglycan-associated protein
MARAHTAIAFGCLVLGMADLLYLDLAVAPSLLGGESAAKQPGAGARAVLTDSDSRPAATAPKVEPPRTERKLDPELSTQTGAQPEPELTGLDTASRVSALGPEGVDDTDVAESEPLPDTLPSAPIHIHFAHDRATLGARARARLHRLAGWLAAEPSLRATIDGHADRIGESLHNQVLSRRRAERVAEYFASAGVSRARLSVRAFGERRPVTRVVGNIHRLNRRVEIRVSPAPIDPGAP